MKLNTKILKAINEGVMNALVDYDDLPIPIKRVLSNSITTTLNNDMLKTLSDKQFKSILQNKCKGATLGSFAFKNDGFPYLYKEKYYINEYNDKVYLAARLNKWKYVFQRYSDPYNKIINNLYIYNITPTELYNYNKQYKLADYSPLYCNADQLAILKNIDKDENFKQLKKLTDYIYTNILKPKITKSSEELHIYIASKGDKADNTITIHLHNNSMPDILSIMVSPDNSMLLIAITLNDKSHNDECIICFNENGYAANTTTLNDSNNIVKEFLNFLKEHKDEDFSDNTKLTIPNDFYVETINGNQAISYNFELTITGSYNVLRGKKPALKDISLSKCAKFNPTHLKYIKALTYYYFPYYINFSSIYNDTLYNNLESDEYSIYSMETNFKANYILVLYYRHSDESYKLSIIDNNKHNLLDENYIAEHRNSTSY